MSSGSDRDYSTLSRFIYDEKYVRDDGHPRKDVFIGPQSTRDISVDRHTSDSGVDWYAGAAVKSGILPAASAELLANVIERPLYVKPYAVPRMPRHADISGWQDAPGWGENKELAKELAKKAQCQRNPRYVRDAYQQPRYCFVINCRATVAAVTQQLQCLSQIERADFECICCVPKGDAAVAGAVRGIELKDRRVVMILVVPSDARNSFSMLMDEKSGVRGESVVFVGSEDSLLLAIQSGGEGFICKDRSLLQQNVDKLRFSENGDILLWE